METAHTTKKWAFRSTPPVNPHSSRSRSNTPLGRVALLARHLQVFLQPMRDG
ncbi:hypothetical protein ACVINH_004710 [Rhizobium anhuiense]